MNTTTSPTADEIEALVAALDEIKGHDEDDTGLLSPCSACGGEAHLKLRLRDYGFSSPATAKVYALLLRAVETALECEDCVCGGDTDASCLCCILNQALAAHKEAGG